MADNKSNALQALVQVTARIYYPVITYFDTVTILTAKITTLQCNVSQNPYTKNANKKMAHKCDVFQFLALAAAKSLCYTYR